MQLLIKPFLLLGPLLSLGVETSAFCSHSIPGLTCFSLSQASFPTVQESVVWNYYCCLYTFYPRERGHCGTILNNSDGNLLSKGFSNYSKENSSFIVRHWQTLLNWWYFLNFSKMVIFSPNTDFCMLSSAYRSFPPPYSFHNWPLYSKNFSLNVMSPEKCSLFTLFEVSFLGSLSWTRVLLHSTHNNY